MDTVPWGRLVHGTRSSRYVDHMTRVMVFNTIAAAALATACARAASLGPAAVPAGYYPASFPTADLSSELSRAFESVKQIQVTVEYDVFSFADGDTPTPADLESRDVTDRAVARERVSQIRRATAVVISRSPDHVLLLTAAHAVFRPDTVIEYVGSGVVPVDAERRIRTLRVKSEQVNWVLDLPGARTFQLLAWDEDQDIALIGFRPLATDRLLFARPISVPSGSPNELRTGSFVYILGYPGGYRMVSRGVATPLDDGRDTFVVDGNWNRGVSGGAILAIREDGRTLEWVGMARAASATAEERVVPPPAAASHYDPRLPYEGPIFLEETLRIQYGVTLSVPMTTIRDFIERNRTQLARIGYGAPAY